MALTKVAAAHNSACLMIASRQESGQFGAQHRAAAQASRSTSACGFLSSNPGFDTLRLPTIGQCRVGSMDAGASRGSVAFTARLRAKLADIGTEIPGAWRCPYPATGRRGYRGTNPQGLDRAARYLSPWPRLVPRASERLGEAHRNVRRSGAHHGGKVAIVFRQLR